VIATLATILRSAAPLAFAAVGETISEKAGVVNLSLDGSLALSALTGFVVAYESGNLWLGFAAAALVGAAIALVVAFASIELRLNQIAVGFVLFQLCLGLAKFFGDSYANLNAPRVNNQPIPLLADIPWIGPIFFDQDITVYASLLLVAGVFWYMFRTRRGLVLQGIGERPEGAHARGIPVNKLRYLYVMIGGALVGLGGAGYSLAFKANWSDKLTDGLGWIALAIVIFGGWHPVRVALGVYMFSGLTALASTLQETFPALAQVLPTLPFPLMILTLVIVNRKWLQDLSDRVPAMRNFLRSEPPGALGEPFVTD
jgi:simple sugar transport system permease protein